MAFLIEINNKKYNLDKKYNILQVCEMFNVNIPKFCYHEKLSIAGNCRMCLVEVKGSIKPVASCALPIMNNMIIFTNSKLVKKAREGILEFILLNHPLDCPICDQGGECDLQDQSLMYGNDKGRFYEYKKTALDKNCGFLIKTVMTRCIQCTRCVRFSKEIAGINSLGLINRGSNMEISTFISKIFRSEISGNVIDLCPVGALTSNPYSFIARPWELKSFNTIDLNDGLCVNIRIDIRNTDILRIIPRYNKNINDFWISDITRFSFDGFKNNRIIYPFFKKNTSLVNISWFNILYYFKNSKEKVFNFILGNFLDLESIFLLKKFSNKYGKFTINLLKNEKINVDFRNNYLLNSTNLINYKNILLIGLNLRMESPILNIFIRNLVQKNITKIYNIGSSYNYNYLNFNFGNNLNEFFKLLEGRSFLSNIFTNNNNKNLIIFGESIFLRNDLKLNFVKNMLKKNIDIKILATNLTTNHVHEINAINSLNKFNDFTLANTNSNKTNEILYLLNTDSVKINNNLANFLIYQGHHNFNNKILLASKNYLILPTLAFFEKSGIFLNFLGIFQKTKFIITPPIYARNDWKILNIIYHLFFKKILFKNLKDVRLNLVFDYNINILNQNTAFILNLKNWNKFFYKINNTIINSYLTNNIIFNQILKASKILNIHSNDLRKKYNNFI